MHAHTNPLYLHQEITLLALRPERGAAAHGTWPNQAVAGGILADLLLAGRLTTEGKRSLVIPADPRLLDEPLLDECLQRVTMGAGPASAQRWVGRFATSRNFHRAAERLCQLGVLRPASERVLLFFSRRLYPEVDPATRREAVERLRAAIFGDEREVEARTATLVALAAATDLLKLHFSKKDLRAHRPRINALKRGEVTGEATAAVIRAVQAAVTAAAAAAASG
jgi:hypothetical protein